jgi:hypothetical protein
MNSFRHIPARSPRQFASALMVWLAALLSVSAGVQPVGGIEVAQIRQAPADAARPGDLPVQRSTSASVQSRVAHLSERGFEALAASGTEGPDAGILPLHYIALPGHRAATCELASRPLELAVRAIGFRARAPPILA